MSVVEAYHAVRMVKPLVSLPKTVVHLTEPNLQTPYPVHKRNSDIYEIF
jgi:hypothetical protein